MNEPEKGGIINLNTVLLSIVLGLSGWTLMKVTALAESQAEMKQQVRNLERVVYRP